MTTTTREQLIDGASTILADAWEWATRTWAVGGDYKYTEVPKGQYSSRYTSFAYELYDTEDENITLLNITDPKWGEGDGWRTWTGQWAVAENPFHIDAEKVADFIVRYCTEGIDESSVPDYGRLGRRAKHTLRAVYFGDDDAFEDYDAVDADAIVQFILFGEVVYG